MGGIYASPNRQKDSKLAHYPPYLAISCGNPSMPPHIQVDDIFPLVLTRGWHDPRANVRGIEGC